MGLVIFVFNLGCKVVSDVTNVSNFVLDHQRNVRTHGQSDLTNKFEQLVLRLIAQWRYFIVPWLILMLQIKITCGARQLALVNMLRYLHANVRVTGS